MKVGRTSRSGFRLALLLIGLALTNLANYDEQIEPQCNCSGYAGLMTIDPAYLVFREGETRRLVASFPEDAQWSLGAPGADVISGISTSAESRRFSVFLTAADPIGDPNAVFHGEGESSFAVIVDPLDPFGSRVIGPYREVPARRTRLEITAEPDDPAYANETRQVTALVIVPWLYVRESGGDYLDPGDPLAPDLEWDSIAIVESFSDREWDFEFDLSDAPSFQSPVSIERLTPNTVKTAVPYADTLNWRISVAHFVPFCLVEEPIHVTATDGDRVIRRTVMARSNGILDTENPERSCPQPADFRD